MGDERIRAAQFGLIALLALAAAPSTAGPYNESGYSDLEMVAAWATSVTDLQRGPKDIHQPELGNATAGSEANVLGEPSMDSSDVLSLGDGGSITVHLEDGIGDGPGDDFAVYENGFWECPDTCELFAELAYVEVSTDGVDFSRFDATSLRTQQVSGFGTVDPTDYHNFGGKHALGSGTGFDLAELGLDDVYYVRLVDVVGDGSTWDHLGSAVFDPNATPFESSGFDLAAVGALHVAPEPGGLAAGLAGLLAVAALARRRGVAACGPRR